MRIVGGVEIFEEHELNFFAKSILENSRESKKD